VDTDPGADESTVVPLLRSGVPKARKRLDGHCERAAVLKMDDEGVGYELLAAGPGLGAG